MPRLAYGVAPAERRSRRSWRGFCHRRPRTFRIILSAGAAGELDPAAQQPHAIFILFEFAGLKRNAAMAITEDQLRP
jgi:hypothetical protein